MTKMRKLIKTQIFPSPYICSKKQYKLKTVDMQID